MKSLTLAFTAFALITGPKLAMALPFQSTGTIVLANVCGNGIVEEGEVCDGGNNCSGDCKGGVYNTEAPSDKWKVHSDQLQAQEAPEVNQIEQDSPHQLEPLDTPEIEIPNPVICGNGNVEGNESCDDGNTVSGDGCSASCQAESLLPGHTLVDQPSREDARTDLADDARGGSGFVAEAAPAHSGCSIQGISEQGGDYSWLSYVAAFLAMATITLRRLTRNPNNFKYSGAKP